MGLELVESPVRQNSLTIGQATLEDAASEPSLRPKSLDEYIGQAKIVNNLKIFLKAALRRAEALDHCLFFGPPTRENFARGDYFKRAWRESENRSRAIGRKRRRFGGDFNESRRRRRAFH